MLIWWIIFIVGLFHLFLYVWNYLNRNNVDYQWKLLNEWTTEQRINAINFLVEKRRISIVPHLIENIDNTDFSTYKDSPKMPETLSCISTSSLQEITEKWYGHTCNSDGSKSKEMIEKIIQVWRDWYVNEYPKWLAEQKQADEK